LSGTQAATLLPRSYEIEPKVIDCDVHPLVNGGVKELFPYMTDAWQRRFDGHEVTATSPLPPSRYRPPGGSVLRADARPPSGGAPGSDPEFARKDLLDKYGVERALLMPIQAAAANAWVDGREAAVLTEAYNRYFLDHWIALDERFRLAMVVAPHNPVRAADQIRRLGNEPGIAAVWLPLLDIRLGQEFHYPIYEAAAELGLPIVAHGSGAEGIYQGAPTFAGGLPTSYGERYAGALSQLAASSLTSLIFEGVFERYPDLKVVFIEMGWTWVGPQLWRMDASWQSARLDLPWLKRAPSDYVKTNVRFTSEPVEDMPKREHLLQIADMMMAEHTLLFSSDYPHWDGDEPKHVFGSFPEALRQRVFRDNALETFGTRLD